MYCDNCGEELPEGARFCKNCGAEVPQPNSGKRKSSWFLGVVIAFVALIVIIGLMTSGNNVSDDISLSLKNVTTSGNAYESVSNGDDIYNYTLTGDFEGVPGDSDDFTVRGIFTDNGLEMGRYEGKLTDSIAVTLEKNELVNVTQIQITVLDSNGNEIFDETYDYDMDDFDLSGLKKDNDFSFVEDREFSFLSE